MGEGGTQGWQRPYTRDDALLYIAYDDLHSLQETIRERENTIDDMSSQVL